MQQPIANSPLSDFYIPKLVHYLSGSNNTFLHRWLGQNQSVISGDLISNLSAITIKPELQGQNALESNADTLGLIIQLIIFAYILLGLTQLINEYLMPCLEKMSLDFDLSETTTGILVAIGISIPELTTNILSVFSDKIEMIGYGFGAIVGSGVFDFTICFGVTALYSFYYHKSAIQFNMKALLRDIYIYLLTLGYLVIVLQDHSVGLFEALILTLLWPIYVLYSILTNKQNQELEIDESMISAKVPFQKAYESFQFHKPIEQDLSKEQESEDEELDKLMKQRNGGNNPIKRTINTGLSKLIKKLSKPFRYVFRKTIPYHKAPMFAFCMIMLYIFFIIKITISTVDALVEQLPVSHTFIGLTMACWGGNISDIMNASIAAKNKKIEFATSSIIGSQIINLQIALGLPWLLSNIMYGGPLVLSLKIGDSSIFLSIVVVFLVVAISLLIIIANRLKLNNSLGVQLISVYVVYFIFEYFNSQ